MNIGEAAAASGVSVKMIRHYEAIGLLPAPARSSAGYRQYGTADVARLQFVRRARAAGFDSSAIAKLLSLWQDQRRPAADVKRLAQAHVHDIEARIADLQRIAASLRHLTAHCRGDDRPDCPILDALASDATLLTAPRHAKSGTDPNFGQSKAANRRR